VWFTTQGARDALQHPLDYLAEPAIAALPKHLPASTLCWVREFSPRQWRRSFIRFAQERGLSLLIAAGRLTLRTHPDAPVRQHLPEIRIEPIDQLMAGASIAAGDSLRYMDRIAGIYDSSHQRRLRGDESLWVALLEFVLLRVG
jgi:hypothetical protein